MTLFEWGSLMFGAGGSAIILFVLRWVKGYYEDKTYFSRVLKFISLIYDEMHTLINISAGVNRILILKLENNGGKPKLGSRLYSTAVHEAYQSPVKSVKAKYQRVLVDEEYIRMLINAQMNANVQLLVQEMKPCMLKDIYDSEEPPVKFSEIFYLTETPKAFYYMSIASTSESDFNNIKVRNAIYLCVNNLRQLFITNKKYLT